MAFPFIALRRSTQKSAPLPVVMSGVRAGERVLQIGIDDPAIAGAIAGKPGINGRVAFLVADERAATLARKVAADAMALAEVEVAAPVTAANAVGSALAVGALPFGDAAFDLVVLHGRTGPFSALDAATLARLVLDIHRSLRPGGRVIVMAHGTAVGLRAWLRRQAGPTLPGVQDALRGAGYRPVRVLADREGYLFTEGLKPQA